MGPGYPGSVYSRAVPPLRQPEQQSPLPGQGPQGPRSQPVPWGDQPLSSLPQAPNLPSRASSSACTSLPGPAKIYWVISNKMGICDSGQIDWNSLKLTFAGI